MAGSGKSRRFTSGSRESGQWPILFPTRDPEKSKALIGAIDAINGKFGRDTVQPAATGSEKKWQMRRAQLLRCYTTRLEDLPRVKAPLAYPQPLAGVGLAWQFGV